MISTAMVMAAGHGTRMRPLTNDRPKALVEVGGRALIDHMLDRLRDAGVTRAVVNVHAFADRLEAHLARRTDLEIIISDERDALLETGGGLVKALPLLGDDPIFIANIDAIWVEWDAALPAMLRAWNPRKMDELFLLADREHCLGYAGAGDFEMTTEGLRRRTATHAPYVYAGVEIFKPKLAQNYSVEPFSRNKIWDKTLATGRVQGLALPGYWMHVGDPDARRAAEIVLNVADV
jgi:MurNAc alpha-1-phosphate uridylyltransferase